MGWPMTVPGTGGGKPKSTSLPWPMGFDERGLPVQELPAEQPPRRESCPSRRRGRSCRPSPSEGRAALEPHDGPDRASRPSGEGWHWSTVSRMVARAVELRRIGTERAPLNMVPPKPATHSSPARPSVRSLGVVEADESVARFDEGLERGHTFLAVQAARGTPPPSSLFSWPSTICFAVEVGQDDGVELRGGAPRMSRSAEGRSRDSGSCRK